MLLPAAADVRRGFPGGVPKERLNTGLPPDFDWPGRRADRRHPADGGEVATRAPRLLANMVARQAAVLSYIDGLAAAAVGAFVCLLFVALMRPAPPSRF